MPPLDPAIPLEDIEHYLSAAERFMLHVSLADYLANEEKRAAVERVLEVAGDSLNKLIRIAPALAEQIPEHRSIIGFRNVLAHGYAELDHTKVYEVARYKAPELLLAVRRLLREADQSAAGS